MREQKRKRRRRIRFGGGLLIYVMVLLVVGGFLLLHVLHDMYEIESNIPKNFIGAQMEKLSEEQISQLFQGSDTYEAGEDLKENVVSFFRTGDFDVKKSGDDIYTVSVNGNDVMQAELKTEKTVNKLGLLTYDIYSLKSLSVLDANRSLLTYTITVPDEDTVTVNGVQVKNGQEEKDDKFADGYEYADIPHHVTYTVTNLTRKPEITITNDGQEVSYEEEKGTITITDEAETFDTLEAAGITDFDVLGFAGNWSLFMTDDLPGYSHGLRTVTADMIPDSQMYNKAVEWATGIDITFTSVHTLDDPPFSKEEVLSVKKYSDDAVAVEVSLDKPMHIDNGLERTDTFHSTIYAVKVDGAWKVVNIAGA